MDEEKSVNIRTVEDPRRIFNGRAKYLLEYSAAGIAIFHIWVNTFGNMSDLWRNSLHLGLLGSLGFLYYSASAQKKQGRLQISLDLALGLLILMSALYLIFFENALHLRNEVPILSDIVFGVIAILLTLELTRRTSGAVIPVLAVILLSYVLFWGQYIEGLFSFRGMSFSRVIYRMYFTDEGLFGLIATISSTYIFLFILFAAFLLRSGGGDFILRLAAMLSNRITGGPGIVAVTASGLMGTISGSAVANTVSTGSITIPMMKKSGFSPRFAAAVETAASTGGQLMPPIMGAGAFIMAQWTQIPYSKIIAVAALPALLFFFSIIFYIILEAGKTGIKPTPNKDTEDPKKIIREGAHFFFPIFILIGMLTAGYTPTYTAGAGIIAIIISSWLSKDHRMGIKDIVAALALGTRNMLPTGILLVATGIIVGIINMTGTAVTFSQLVVEWSGNSVFLAILLITVSSLLLGMGLPVTAAYIMIAILAAPALTTLGVSLLAAHMIIFWLSQDSNVTPPVCLAAFAASSISGSKPMETGLTAWKLAKGLYIIPLLFAYSNLIDGDWTQRITIFVFALAGFFAFTVGMTGYLRRNLSLIFRAAAILSAGALFWPGNLWINSGGLLCLVLIYLVNRPVDRENIIN